MQLMVVKITFDGFARRLSKALDNFGVPPKGQNREKIVAKMFGVSQAATHKWFASESIPRQKNLREISKHLGVTVEWLLTGNPDYQPKWVIDNETIPEEIRDILIDDDFIHCKTQDESEIVATYRSLSIDDKILFKQMIALIGTKNSLINWEVDGNEERRSKERRGYQKQKALLE